MSVSDEYQIRAYEQGEEQKIVDLLSEIFFEWKARGDGACNHWRWMYQDSPLGHLYVSVIVKDGNVVGVGHDLQIYVKIGKGFEKAIYCTDMAVHPDHRRRGLYARMLDILRLNRGDTNFRYWYTTSRILIDERKRKDQDGVEALHLFPVEINRYLLIKDIDLHLEKKHTDNSWLKKQGYIINRMVASLRSNASNSSISTEVEICEGLDYDAADNFWVKVQSMYNFVVVRNREYLEWRFGDPRSGDYHILSAYRNGEYSGYIVASIDHETIGYPMGNIIDFFTIGDADVDNALLNGIMTWLVDKEINAVSVYAVKGSHVSQALERFGFMDRGDSLFAGYHITSKPNDSHPDIEQSDVNQIHLMYSDFFVK